MEFIIWVIGIVLVFSFIGWLIEVIKDWKNSIDWGKFFKALLIGGIAFSILFSFTAEGVHVIIGAYFVLIIVPLTFGAFKKSTTLPKEIKNFTNLKKLNIDNNPITTIKKEELQIINHDVVKKEYLSYTAKCGVVLQIFICCFNGPRFSQK